MSFCRTSPCNDSDRPDVERAALTCVSSGTNRDVVIEVDDDGIGWLRFGRIDDGLPVNGQPPEPGQIIEATYRTGNGEIGNIGAGAIRSVLDDGRIAASLRDVLAGPGATVTNPVPAQGGTEPETIEQVRQRAPFAFRQQERAVTAEDYAERAQQFGLPGPARIQRAVASIRWTGSWYTVVVAVDPSGSETADPGFLAEVRDYLDRYRMAGHDLQVVAAEYAAAGGRAGGSRSIPPTGGIRSAPNCWKSCPTGGCPTGGSACSIPTG